MEIDFNENGDVIGISYDPQEGDMRKPNEYVTNILLLNAILQQLKEINEKL